VRAQHGVDSCLPATALPPIGLDHGRIKAQRLIDLRAGLSRTAASPRDRLSGVGAKDLSNEGPRWSRPLEVLARPFGLSSSGREAASSFFVAITLDLSRIGLAKADDVHRVAAKGNDRHMKPLTQWRHHAKSILERAAFGWNRHREQRSDAAIQGTVGRPTTPGLLPPGSQSPGVAMTIAVRPKPNLR
jgi:hypothetical protein